MHKNIILISCIIGIALFCTLCTVFAEPLTGTVPSLQSQLNEEKVDEPYMNQLWEKIDTGDMELKEPHIAEIGKIITKLSELEEYGTTIVKGTFLNDSKQELLTYPDGIPYWGATISSFKVDQVYMGSLTAGETIQIGELYYTYNNQTALDYSAQYLPSRNGIEYIFFLTQTPEGRKYAGVYAPVQYEKGRYPLLPSERSIDDSSNNDLSLAPGDSDVYRSLYNEVMQKYK